MEDGITPGEVRLNWSRVRKGGTGAYVEHVVNESLFVAFTESADGTGAIGIPLDLREKLPNGITGEGLEASRASLELGGRMQSCLVLFCSTVELEKVFSEFVAALLARVKEGLPPKHAITEVVREYRALLRRQQPGNVSREIAMGLAGELLVLRKMTGFSRDAWKTWNGPLDQTHDFFSGHVALEVKATSHEAEPSFEVANLTQLYPPAGGELYLVHHVLVPNPQGQVTVSTLAEEICAELADPAGFEAKLAEIDFYRSAPEAWDEHVFQLTHSAMYRVEEGFPRMSRDVADEAPAGVSDIRYRVHLSQAAAFRMNDPAEVDAVYAGMGG